MKRLALCFSLLMASEAAFASDWIQIPGLFVPNSTAYVDMASVREDTYAKKDAAIAIASIRRYRVAWIETKD